MTPPVRCLMFERGAGQVFFAEQFHPPHHIPTFYVSPDRIWLLIEHTGAGGELSPPGGAAETNDAARTMEQQPRVRPLRGARLVRLARSVPDARRSGTRHCAHATAWLTVAAPIFIRSAVCVFFDSVCVSVSDGAQAALQQGSTASYCRGDSGGSAGAARARRQENATRLVFSLHGEGLRRPAVGLIQTPDCCHRFI